MTISIKAKALSSLESMLNSGKLDHLILYDLIESYKFSKESEGAEGWELREGLRKVIQFYATESEYEEFKRECL